MMPAMNRGQSGIDFVIGFGVFFLTFSFVILLIPDLLSPFATPEGQLVADRSADTLAGGLLSSGTVGSLNETCTTEFFTQDGTSCSFDASDSLPELAGVSDRHSLNVTLEHNTSGSTTEIACYDNGTVVECPNGQRLVRGKSPPENTRSVETASQVVRVAGEPLWLRVRAW